MNPLDKVATKLEHEALFKMNFENLEIRAMGMNFAVDEHNTLACYKL